ncbi:MAG: glycerol-3-phosphate 1-O-acyltransferase PlsY [Gemmatimonadetes bacterium]|nr:glycerol-3-phosphate 1-O-acyltransferase PlsY [Gemmatimonadota bacterium]
MNVLADTLASASVLNVPVNWNPWLCIGVAYLVGSFPSAYLAGRVNGIDLRTVGSGNLGATNVMRALGMKWALPVYVADTLKGALPAGLLPWLIDTGYGLGPSVLGAHASDTWAVVYGAAAIAGHARPAFLLFRGGGKGVATGCGVFLAIAPGPTLLSLILFGLVLWRTGYVSLGSLVGAATLPVFVALVHGPTHVNFVAACLIAVFVSWTHRANIGRLRRGEEPSFKRRAAEPGA